MKIGIVGCGGRMGRMLIEAVLQTEGAKLAGGSERAGSDLIGQDVAGLVGADPVNISITDSAADLFAGSDVVIDFTIPEASVSHAVLAAQTGTALVVGTTGFDESQISEIETAGRSAVIMRAGNMSVGVNMLLGLVEQTAKALGEEFDIEVVEMHHKHKVDAPSGTALMLGEAAADGRGVNLADVSQRTRDGFTGPRKAGDIGFATLRGGDVVGEHSVIFAGEGERIEISHKASNRLLFANGAVRAALWTKDQKPGHYSMKHVLGFED